MIGAKWLAVERGAFKQPEVTLEIVPPALVVPPATYKIADGMTDVDLLLLFSFREQLPSIELRIQNAIDILDKVTA